MRNARPWLITLAALAAPAALGGQEPPVKLEQANVSGPRVGVTFVTGSAARQRLAEYDLDPVMSQFGWHFERAHGWCGAAVEAVSACARGHGTLEIDGGRA